jgi:hypothetical protein
MGLEGDVDNANIMYNATNNKIPVVAVRRDRRQNTAEF